MKFSDKIMMAVKEKQSVLVVGLDPNLSYYPTFIRPSSPDIKQQTEAIYNFNKLIIDCVYKDCVAIKPQLAYYEVFGSLGIKALEMTISYAKERGLLVINDAKRGDIGSTCEAYAKAFLGENVLSGDAVTVNPYLGRDGILPFIEMADKNEKGIFVLVKTSNPSSGDLQDVITKQEKTVYLEVATMIDTLSKDVGEYGFSDIGVVVGATYPKEAKEIREVLRTSIFLVPGYGAQGATGKDLISYFNEDGLGSLISSSRGITYPHLKTDVNVDEDMFKDMVVQAVKEANDDINSYRKI
jgi:orotidine-5'-phosphate decarboxylase